MFITVDDKRVLVKLDKGVEEVVVVVDEVVITEHKGGKSFVVYCL